jgi:hypothetical protein
LDNNWNSISLKPLFERNKEKINPRIRQKLNRLISQLEEMMTDLQARLPAHSIPPNLIAEMDEIDEQLQETKLNLAELDEEG